MGRPSTRWSAYERYAYYLLKLFTMKNYFFLLLLAALSVSLSTTSCEPYDDSDEKNVIVDEEGIDLVLTWENSASDPTLNTRLQLQIAETDNNILLYSDWWATQPSIALEPGALNDGTYNINVYIYEIDRLTDYTITATGRSTGKTYSKTYGPINVNDRYLTLYPWTLTVSGDKFKLAL